MSTEALSKTLDVSPETIRRDLMVLEKKGLLSRVHGGAALTSSRFAGEEASFSERAVSDRDGKDRIGVAAAALLSPGQSIFIDLGTTALAVARAIPTDFRGTVATCSLLAAIELADRPNLEVLVSGGRVRRGDLAVSSFVAQEFFAGFYPDVAILGSGGVDATAGITDYHLDEVSVRRTVMANSAASWVLADHRKIGQVARYKVAPLTEVSGVITDDEPGPGFREAVEKHGGHVVVS
jgi:DeoR family transcriptional regulator, fructose operon transcriptional repressor